MHVDLKTIKTGAAGLFGAGHKKKLLDNCQSKTSSSLWAILTALSPQDNFSFLLLLRSGFCQRLYGALAACISTVRLWLHDGDNGYNGSIAWDLLSNSCLLLHKRSNERERESFYVVELICQYLVKKCAQRVLQRPLEGPLVHMITAAH